MIESITCCVMFAGCDDLDSISVRRSGELAWRGANMEALKERTLHTTSR
jgi:hypothetical protein